MTVERQMSFGNIKKSQITVWPSWFHYWNVKLVLCIVQLPGLSLERNRIGQVAIYFLMLMLSWWAHWLVTAPACHQPCQGNTVSLWKYSPVGNKMGSSEICSANGLVGVETCRRFKVILYGVTGRILLLFHWESFSNIRKEKFGFFVQLIFSYFVEILACFFAPISTEIPQSMIWRVEKIFNLDLIISKIKWGSGEIVGWLRALTLLAEDPGSVLRTQLEIHYDLQFQVQVFCCRLLASSSTAHTWCTYRHAHKTFRHRK